MERSWIGVLVILAITISGAASAQAAQISIEPAYISAAQGDTFTVNITVDPEGAEAYGAEYALYFNNILLRALSQNKGQFLSQDGNSTMNIRNNIETSGKIEYGEMRQGEVGGVTNPGILATIEFEVIRCSGADELRLYDVLVSNPYAQTIEVTVNNATVENILPPVPFLIRGYVSYENGSECSSPTVNMTNLDTGKEWTAEKNESSNYYQVMLAGCADITAGETLQFNTISLDGSRLNVTEHTVTQDEVDAGGFGYNITLDAHDVFIKPDYTGAYNTGIRIDNVTTEEIPLDHNLTTGDTYFLKYKVVNNGSVETETVNITVKISNATWSEELANYHLEINSYHLGNVSWNTTGLAPGNYNITVNASIPMDSSPEDNERTREVTLESPPVPDTTPPASITDLQSTIYEETYINWTWNDPEDADFSHVIVYLDGTYVTDVPKGIQFYNATELTPGTSYNISTHTMDTSGNMNQTWINHTATTLTAGEIRGDVNRNGKRDTGDATLMLRTIVELPIPSLYQPVLPIGDMNCNNRIDTGDATLVLRDIVSLPIPKCWE